jgi:hypothetical protein
VCVEEEEEGGNIRIQEISSGMLFLFSSSSLTHREKKEKERETGLFCLVVEW